MTRILAPALVAFVLATGCASTYDEPVNSALNAAATKGFTRMAKHAAFDPYAATVHAPDRDVAPLWDQTLADLRAAASQAGFTMRTFAEACRLDAFGNCDRQQPALRARLVEAGVGERWVDNAVKQLREKGWALTQREPAEGDLHHGDYRVPAAFLTQLNFTMENRLFQHDFVIGGKDAPRAAPASAPPKSPDAKERLLKLKQLRDDGVITEEEYNRRRTEIVNSL